MFRPKGGLLRFGSASPDQKELIRRRKAAAGGGGPTPPPPPEEVDLFDGSGGFGFVDDSNENLYVNDTDGDLSPGFAGLNNSSAGADPTYEFSGFWYIDDGA